jgi:erythromycin esterase-like protein
MLRGRRWDSPGATEPETTAAIGAAARPLTGSPADLDGLLDMVSGARLVLLGEASHGTHEFYAARAAITRRLIAEHGFAAVVAEADWPDAERINCFVRGESDDPDPLAALGDFQRFPLWMWRNSVVREFVGWLRAHNDALPPSRPRVGFYGMDLYSLHSSIEAVLAYLDRVDPQAARRARDRYACFEHFGPDPQRYGYLAGYGAESCEEDVISQLMELRGAGAAGVPSRRAEDEHFYAEQNARLVKNAEAYYRSMFRGRDESWNLRDTHMAETIGALMAHLDRRFGGAKLVVWAHNSHLGDARATEMGERGELNVGQLIRQRYGREALLVGLTTYRGEVTAASDWGEPAERKRVRDALPGSYEALLHDVAERRGAVERAAGGSDRAIGGGADFFVNLRDDGTIGELLRRPRLERAIGVIYRPESERASHYFHARLPEQFDAVLHFDTTRALEPLDAPAADRREPETLPTGL